MVPTYRPVLMALSAAKWMYSLWTASYVGLFSRLYRLGITTCVVIFAVSVLPVVPALGQDAFITTWQTTTSNESITIPTDGGENTSDYDFTIKWGDGTSETVTGNDPDPSHTYSAAGTYTIEIRGTFPHLFLDASFSGDGDAENAEKLQTIEQWGDIQWESMNSAFEGARNMTDNSTDAPDLSGVSSMREMFREATAFNGDVGDWDVSTVTTMRLLFDGATTFNRDIGGWDVAGVSDMGRMFRDAPAFNQDIGGWDVSNVTEMPAMFKNAFSFNQDIGDWDVSNVQNMERFFVNATSFNQDIGGWTLANVTKTATMFEGATAFNQDIGSWDVSRVTDMSDMFHNAESFNQDLSAWDVSNVRSFHGNDGFLFGANLSSSNYDALLAGWETLDLQSGRSFHAGTSKYSSSTGAPARTAISNDHNWSFTDAGEISASAITLTDGSNYDPAVLEGESDDNPLARLEMRADNSGASVPSFIVATCGTNQGVENVRLWHSSASTFDTGTADPLASMALSPSTSTPSTILLTDFQQSIPTSRSYFYVTADVTPSVSGDVQLHLRKGTDVMRDAGTLTNAADEFPMSLASTSGPLPTQTEGFTATLEYAQTVLTWQANADAAPAGFEINRRTSDSDEWTPIGTTESPAETGSTFRFSDEDMPGDVDTVIYRLQQTAPNGCVYHSESIAVETEQVETLTFEKTFPNPAQEDVTVRYAVPDGMTNLTLELYDILGRQVRSIEAPAERGRHELQLNAHRLSSGTYILRLAGNNQTRTQRFVIVQ